MFIQNAEEVFAGCDPALVLCEVILNKRQKCPIPDPLTQIL